MYLAHSSRTCVQLRSIAIETNKFTVKFRRDASVMLSHSSLNDTRSRKGPKFYIRRISPNAIDLILVRQLRSQTRRFISGPLNQVGDKKQDRRFITSLFPGAQIIKVCDESTGCPWRRDFTWNRTLYNPRWNARTKHTDDAQFKGNPIINLSIKDREETDTFNRAIKFFARKHATPNEEEAHFPRPFFVRFVRLSIPPSCVSPARVSAQGRGYRINTRLLIRDSFLRKRYCPTIRII